jgi:hypothetical protein
MRAIARVYGPLLRDSFLRAVLGGMVASMIAATAGCAKSVCSSDSDCGPGYLCIDNERCVADPREARDASPGNDASGPDSGVQPSSCDSETQTFDPGQVYLLGGLPALACTPSAMAALASPDLESVGFPCNINAQSAVIRPADGRLLYIDATSAPPRLLAFTLDAHLYDTGAGACAYPAAPAANDEVIATVSCNASGGPGGFLLAPDVEGVWYTCAGAAGLWFDENDAMLGFLGTRTPLLRGYGNSLLMSQSTAEVTLASSLLLNVSGSDVPLGELPQDGAVLAVRARDTGFQVAVRGDGEGANQLWDIGLDGSVTLAGTYPDPPSGVALNDLIGVRSALSATGALYAAAVDSRSGTAYGAVVELVPGVAATVIYTEANAPEVTLAAGSALVTGP